MPNGNATVILRPEVLPDGSFILDSSGRRFGDVGFYRVANRGTERLRRVQTLRERFHVYGYEAQALRCGHTVRFLGMLVLWLHYKIVPVAPG
jgi:hypothetical protein